PDTMMRLNLRDDIAPEFAAAVIGSTHGRVHMRRSAAGSATSMVKINRTSLGRLPFPVVAVREQKLLLGSLSVLNQGIDTVDSEVQRLSTLKAAFFADVFGGN